MNAIPPSPDHVAVAIVGAIRRDRDSRRELKGVRALGMWLPSRAIEQVSMNLTMPEITSLPAVFDAVREYARAAGADISESEVIGLIPESALGGEPPVRILWTGYRKTQILEYWLRRIDDTKDMNVEGGRKN